MPWQVGVEPSGEGLDRPGRHSATLTKGRPGELHGMACYVLEDEEGKPSAVHSIASGLDYPGVGPQHCYLKVRHITDRFHTGDRGGS